MPWAVAAAGVAAAGSYAAADNAADKQAGAAGAASAASDRQYLAAMRRNEPFYNAGTNALSILQQRLGELTAGYDPAKLTQEAGYQFGLQQGQQALERSLAARGRGVSGAALKAAAEYGTNYGTTKLNDAFTRDMQGKNQIYNQLMGLTQIGQASANNTNALGAQNAASVGSNLIGAGNAQAAASLAQGNAWQGLINQGLSTYNQTRTPTASTAPAWSTAGGGRGAWDYNTGGYQDATAQLGWADGGEVPEFRREPKVGTKAPPRKGGGGGGMSREAVLAALAEMDAKPPAAGGVAALPGNPVTDPGAILRGRERAAGLADGGAVRTATSGRADDVAINVSGGEHVLNADVVSALGDGNSEAGHALLEELAQRALAHRDTTAKAATARRTAKSKGGR